MHSSKEKPCNSMQPIMECRHTELLDTKPRIRSDFILPLFTPHFHFCELLLHFMYCILSGFDDDCCFCCKSVELWMYISRYLGKVLL
jgi:hypothetical protein